ncbi:MAG TPA: helix-turn-helix domain-containing protein [Nocardioides sp.]
MSAIESEAVSKVLTIDEAAAILRISRNSAYAAARRWRTTGGSSGLPCIEIGRILRVPRADLDRLLGRADGPDAP